MAKGQQKSNREAKKPKKTALVKSPTSSNFGYNMPKPPTNG